MGKSVLYKIYLGASPWSDDLRKLQAAALGIADRHIGKVSGRTEFYQRLKALNAVPVKEPTKGQAVITAIGPNVIGAIKNFRELTYAGLHDAKDEIEKVRAGGQFKFENTTVAIAEQQAKVMREAGCTVQVNLS